MRLLAAFFISWSLLAAVAPSAASDVASSAGRLEWTTSDGTCSAALIEADLIVTAAHCVDPERDIRLDAPRLFFRPAAPAFAPPIAVVGGSRHPLYTPDRDDLIWRFPFDLAVLRLARPLPETTNPSLATGGVPLTGELLSIMTWTRATDEPVVRPCEVLPGPVSLVTLGCHVQGGESGGAVLRHGAGGTEIVAILTSRTRIGSLDLAQASHLDGRLAPMLRGLDNK